MEWSKRVLIRRSLDLDCSFYEGLAALTCIDLSIDACVIFVN